jgi:hypothetical protein
MMPQKGYTALTWWASRWALPAACSIFLFIRNELDYDRSTATATASSVCCAPGNERRESGRGLHLGPLRPGIKNDFPAEIVHTVRS